MSNKYKKLKKDIAAFPYPVFGLRKSVYDLEYVDHYEEDGRFTICYQSSNRLPYSFFGRNVHTLSQYKQETTKCRCILMNASHLLGCLFMHKSVKCDCKFTCLRPKVAIDVRE